MSEELHQKNYTKNGDKFDKYEYYNIGNTTIKELKKFKIIKEKDYKEFEAHRPDGLLVDRRNKKRIDVIAVVEYKKPDEFNSKEKKENASKQCNTYCQVLGAELGIVTDGKDTIWINPKVEIESADLVYNDNEIFNEKMNKQRGFSYIKREDGYHLSQSFILDLNKKEETKSILKLIEKIKQNISKDNSQFKKEEFIDPYNLAVSVHQDVWTATSASPEKALSTFIEIFMFKFLSDLGVLKFNSSNTPVSFDDVFLSGKDTCLKYYFTNVRGYMKEIFPSDLEDGTTLINGMSLNPDLKEENHVFYNILKKFHDFGSLKNINPEFKSRLFEDFLKKSISKKNWGQFFTPRNVVKAVIEMSEMDKLPDGAKICDPACGVGGFLMEPLNTKRANDFYFSNGKLKSKLKYFGYDRARGKEIDDKLTIILAKANFVIYLSELLQENPTLTEEFADMYNRIFKIYTKTILGSLSEVKMNEYDLILSNPPYVTSGSSNYKKAIKESEDLSVYYKTPAIGLEGLFMLKMIQELKPNGKALIIIPDGILNRINDHSLRKFILETCILDGIVSLPINTFYKTPKKTYIISLTKKEEKDIGNIQKEPVFTYLVSNIGETLDVNRFAIEENDLKSMVMQYKYFMVDKNNFSSNDARCKVQDISRFEPNSHWSVDRWWTKEEKIELGIENEDTVLSEEEFFDKIGEIGEQLMSLAKLNRKED